MAAIQLNFTLRTSANCKTVHLLGSWDNYNGQLPLSKDANKTGGWKGTFRFHGLHPQAGPALLVLLHHRRLPRLARPQPATPSPSPPPAASSTSSTSQRQRPVRPLPPGHRSASPAVSAPPVSPRAARSLHPRSSAPKPVKPNQTRQITTEQFAHPTVEMLAAKFAAADLDDSDDSDSDSDAESDVPSLSSRSSNSSTPSSASSVSSCCTCERYGITRAGSRVKLDCGGSRCGYSDGSECSSESEDEYRARSTRRQGMVIRK